MRFKITTRPEYFDEIVKELKEANNKESGFRNIFHAKTLIDILSENRQKGEIIFTCSFILDGSVPRKVLLTCQAKLNAEIPKMLEKKFRIYKKDEVKLSVFPDESLPACS